MTPAQPQLRRWRSTYPRATVTKGARLCGESISNDSGGSSAGVGWCFNAASHTVADGVELSIMICRDDTGGGTLNYRSAREVDIVVRHGDKTVWDWAQDHPDHPRAHQLTAAANGCWNWALTWAGNTRSGAAAPHGNYTFVATTTARELSAYAPRAVDFSY